MNFSDNVANLRRNRRERDRRAGRTKKNPVRLTFIVTMLYDKSVGQSYAFVKVETPFDGPVTLSQSILDGLKARAALFPSGNSVVCCKLNVSHRA